MVPQAPVGQVVTVGQPFTPGITRIPVEGLIYDYFGQHTLRLIVPNPSQAEIQAVQSAPLEFALCVEESVIVLLTRIENVTDDWADAYYQHWLVPSEERVLPPRVGEHSSSEADAVEERAIVSLILINNQTGIVDALRCFTWSPAFTDRMHQAIRQQARTAWHGREDHEKRVHRIQRKYPVPSQMLGRSLIRCTSGD